MFVLKDYDMEEYLIGIGKRIKGLRKESNKTISEIAILAGVTAGLISRIENGRTIPSLPVLLNIIKSLNIEVAEFFNDMTQETGSNYIISRKEENTLIEKEDEAFGFSYTYLFSKQMNSIGFEAVLLEVHPNSKREKVVTDAFEFKFMLSGSCTYIIDNEEVEIHEGDSIFFDGRFPHVPKNKSSNIAKMLVLYFFI